MSQSFFDARVLGSQVPGLPVRSGRSLLEDLGSSWPQGSFHSRLENSAVGIGSTGCARWHGSGPGEIFTRAQVCCSRNMYSETKVSAARADHRPNPKTGPVHLGTSRQAFAEAIPLRCWNLFDGFRQVRPRVPLFQSASDAQRHALQPGQNNTYCHQKEEEDPSYEEDEQRLQPDPRVRL